MKKYFLAPMVAGVLLIPFAASAITVDEIRAQIQALLTQVAALQAQLDTITTNPQVTPPATSMCPNLYRTLARGSRGDDVAALQRFLIAEGLLSSDSATGFFGQLTEEAVQRWQAQRGVVASGTPNSTGYGVVGGLTRVAIASRCAKGTTVVNTCPNVMRPLCPNGTLVSNGTDSNGCSLGYSCIPRPQCTTSYTCPLGYTMNTVTVADGCPQVSCIPPAEPTPFRASATTGTAPLTVTFSGLTDACIVYGDGGQECAPPESSMSSTQHTYTTPGTYTATNGNRSITITVGGMVSTAFSASPTSGTAPLTVRFTNINQAGAASITFGDGTQGDWQDGVPAYIAHTYTTPGVYTATLNGGGPAKNYAAVTLGSVVITVY